jgi:hypothetical protein
MKEKKKFYTKAIIKRNPGYFMNTGNKIYHLDTVSAPLTVQAVPAGMLWGLTSKVKKMVVPVSEGSQGKVPVYNRIPVLTEGDNQKSNLLKMMTYAHTVVIGSIALDSKIKSANPQNDGWLKFNLPIS